MAGNSKPRGAIVDAKGNLTRVGAAYFDNKLDDGDARLLDIIWPIGSFFYSSQPNPPSHGTWVQVEGVFIVGQKDGDPDFGTAGTTGGAKTHLHKINPPPSNTGGPSATQARGDVAGTLDVPSDDHHHTVNIAEFDSDTVSHLPPWKAAYIWERTA
ncbi:MAG: hypothetical protein ABFD97_18305 [Syntrophobacter sp.]